MTKATFNTGDIVKLKSSGPEMTVQKEISDDHYRCPIKGVSLDSTCKCNSLMQDEFYEQLSPFKP